MLMARFLRWSVLTLALLLFLPILSSATPTSPVDLQVLSSSSRQLPVTSNGSIAAQGGNVTQVNINALTITKAWQGYYGNITGNIRLDDASNQTFYSWGNATPSGEVYATRNGTIQWDTVNCTNVTQRATEETYLGQSVADGDSVTNTFNLTTHESFLVGLRNITQDTCYSTYAFANGASQSQNWSQVLLSDNSSNLIYTTVIDADTVGYNGQTVDFQLMVGENEHPGNEGVTSYYFFVELS